MGDISTANRLGRIVTAQSCHQCMCASIYYVIYLLCVFIHLVCVSNHYTITVVHSRHHNQSLK